MGTRQIEDLRSYKHFFEAFPDAVYAVDLEGNYIEVNPAGEQLTGYSREELLGMRIHQLVPPEERHRREYSATALQIHKPHTFETTMIHKSGRLIELQVTRTPVVENGQLVAVMGVSKDITELKRTQQELLKRNELFNILAQNSQDIITFSSEVGLCEYISPSVKTLLGYDPSEIIGSTLNRLFHPDDFDLFVKGVGEQIVRGLTNTRFVSRARSKTGSYVWIQTTVKVTRNAETNGLRVIAIGRDITDEMRLRESLDKAVKIAGLGHWERDYPSEVLKLSGQMAELLGLPGEVDKISLEEFFSYVHPEDADTLREQVGVTRATGIPLNHLYRIIHADGSIRYLYSQAEVVERDGFRIRVLGTCQDVTEQRKTHDLLRRAEQLKSVGQLAAGIAHEIRNPLTALKGFTQLLGAKSRQPNKQFFDIMRNELDRIEAILNEMLVLAKPNASVFRPANIRTILNEVITLMTAQAMLRGVELSIEAPQRDDSSLTVNCDAIQLKQVFINLIKNGIEAMPQGGTFRFYLRSSCHEILIDFADEGEGIPKDRIPKLGEPFYTTKESGTGLGLLVSREIIERHHGHLTITSEVGKGTIVSITLPLTGETKLAHASGGTSLLRTEKNEMISE